MWCAEHPARQTSVRMRVSSRREFRRSIASVGTPNPDGPSNEGRAQYEALNQKTVRSVWRGWLGGY